MTKRNEHTFQFKANDIAYAAKAERKYHEQRLEHWKERRDKALEKVKTTIGAKVTEIEGTGGHKDVQVVVDYGDKESWSEYQTATRKIASHEKAIQDYGVDERVYGSQANRLYDLDTADVAHFRLGGEPRED